MFNKSCSLFKIRTLLLVSIMAITNVSIVFAAQTRAENSINLRPDLANERQDINRSKSIIKDVISKSPFVNVEEEINWKFKDTDQTEDVNDKQQMQSPDLAWLKEIIDFIALIIELLLWMLPILVVFYLYRYRHYWYKIIHKKHVKPDEVLLPDTLFGLDVKRDSLPADIEFSANQLWENKKYRDAVSILYRGSLVVLFEKYRFQLPAGATEQDCIRYLEKQSINNANLNENFNKITPVETADSNRLHRFKRITDVWIIIAYAHQFPDANEFSKICSNWNELFNMSLNASGRDSVS